MIAHGTCPAVVSTGGHLLPELASTRVRIVARTCSGRIEFRFYCSKARYVSVAGDFNDWDVHRHPMLAHGNGCWSCRFADSRHNRTAALIAFPPLAPRHRGGQQSGS